MARTPALIGRAPLLRFFVALALAIVIAQPSCAQSAPSWSADASIGGGRGRGSPYFSDGLAVAHLAVNLRASQSRVLGVYFEASYDWLGLGGNPDKQCIVTAPGSACQEPYTDIAGPAALVGALFAPVSGVELRAGIGAAAYSVEGNRAGAVVGQFDAAAFPVSPLGITVGWRPVVIPSYRQQRLSVIPVLVGLRIR